MRANPRGRGDGGVAENGAVAVDAEVLPEAGLLAARDAEARLPAALAVRRLKRRPQSDQSWAGSM